MAADASVKAAITALRAKWPDDKQNQAPGVVPLWIPVDNDSLVKFPCSGRAIRYLGFTEDAFSEDDWKKLVVGGVQAPSGANRRFRQTSGFRNGRLILKPVTIYLNTAIPFPTAKDANRVMLKFTLRVPQLVSVDCMNYFLYNMSSVTGRPSGFSFTRNQRYNLSPLTRSQLGTISTNDRGRYSQTD